MSLTINQVLPSNDNVPVNKNKKNNDTAKTKIDICPSVNLSKLLKSIDLPDIELPGFDLPSIDSKLLKGLNLDFVSDFTKKLITNLKLKNMYIPFKCSYLDMSSPFGKNLINKNNLNKLKNINCKDITSGLNNSSNNSNMLKSALGIDNCAKSAITVVNETSDILDELGIENDIKNNPLSRNILSSVVDNKLDIKEASKLLNSEDRISVIREQYILTKTISKKIIKVSKETFKSKDKDSILSFGKSITSTQKLLDSNNNDFFKLAKLASKDSNVKITQIPVIKKLSISQNLSLLNKAKQQTAKFNIL